MKTKATKTNAGYEYRGYNITKIGAGGPSGVAMTAWLIDGTPMEFRTLTMCVDAIDYFSRVIVQAPDTTNEEWWIEHLYDLAPADLAHVISEAQLVLDDANATVARDTEDTVERYTFNVYGIDPEFDTTGAANVVAFSREYNTNPPTTTAQVDAMATRHGIERLDEEVAG